MTDDPVGRHCPGCGHDPVPALGDRTQCWCNNPHCQVLVWDPTKTLRELITNGQWLTVNGPI